MDTEKYNPGAIRNAFRFLMDELGYSVVRDVVLSHAARPYAFVVEYVGHDRRIVLNHDYRDEFFEFKIVRGLNTQFPNDSDLDNIVPFIKIFCKYEPSLDFISVQPHGKTCAEAAQINAALLRKYGCDILLGKDWI